MMKKLFFVAVFMLFIMLPNSAKASTISNEITIPTISKVYTEGFYRFDNTANVDIGITLTNDTPTKIIILDEEMDIEFISKIPYNYKLYLRNIEPGKIIGIVGEGKIAMTFEPPK